jgi:DNA-binding transcriptional LysR family regulator
MLPTEFAEQIAPRFEELLLELDDIRYEAQLYRNLDKGQLRVGVGQAVREPLSRHCLPRFVEQHPGISLAVLEGTAPELARALQQREVDMILAGATSYSHHEFGRLEHLLDIPVRVLVRQGHPLADRKQVLLRDILNYPQVAPTALGEQHPFRKQADFRKDQSLDPHVLCSDYSALESIVQQTDAWTVGLETRLHREPPESLAVLNVLDFDIRIELSVIELKRRSRSPAAEHFIQTVKSVLASE